MKYRSLFLLFCLVSTLIAYKLPDELFYFLQDKHNESIDHDVLKKLEFIYREKPLINTIKIEEISYFFWLSQGQIQWILQNHPTNYQSVSKQIDISQKELRLLKLFTSIPKKRKPKIEKNYSVEFSERVYTKIPEIDDTSFTGSNLDHYAEITGQYQNFHLFINLNKDLQEDNYFDFYNYNFQYNYKNSFKIILGDYQANWAQGLTMWKGYSFDYFLDNPGQIKKNEKNISAYYGSAQNNGLSGIAFNYHWKFFKIETILSRKIFDANFDDNGEVTSLYTSGYHRTENEKEKKEYLRENLIGNLTQLAFERFTFGHMLYLSHYDPEFTNEINYRDENRFKGSANFVTGIYMNYNFLTNATSFTEISLSKNGGKALLTGITFKKDQTSGSLFFQYYSKKYQNLHSNPLSLSSNPDNVKGTQIALKQILSKKQYITLVISYYTNLDRTYLSLFPKKRFKNELKYQWDHFYIVFNYKHTLEFPTSTNTENKISEYGIKSTFSKKINSYFYLLFKSDFKIYNTNITEQKLGYNIALRPNFNFSKLKFQNNISYFNSDNYESRSYLYCNDIPGMWNLQMFYMKGIHLYTLLKYQFGTCDLQTKISYTLYNQEMSLSGRNTKNLIYLGFYLNKEF